MKRHAPRLCFVLLSIAVAGCLSADNRPAGVTLGPTPGHMGAPMIAQFVPPQPLPIVDEWCVALAPGTDPQDLANQLNLQLLRHAPALRLALFEGEADPSDFTTEDGVVWVDENEAVIWSLPLELTLGFSQGQWDQGEVEGQAALQPLKLPAAHARAGGAGVRVAVLDTGADPNHPFLAGRLELLPPSSYLGSLETPNGIDDDNNGTVDDAYGHGTHVAGTILTVAPRATVLPIRVLNEEGWGTLYDLAAGLTLALNKDVDVVNLSLSLTAQSPLIEGLLAQLDAAGVVVLAAAGNQTGGVLYPGSDINSIAVAATEDGPHLASFSGAWVADLAAPGVQVASSFPPDKLAYGTGTSMATAVASGCVALVGESAQGPAIGWALQALCASARPVTPTGALLHGEVLPLNALPARGIPASEEHQWP